MNVSPKFTGLTFLSVHSNELLHARIRIDLIVHSRWQTQKLDIRLCKENTVFYDPMVHRLLVAFVKNVDKLSKCHS